MLDYETEDRFLQTGITRGMVNRVIPAWNEGLAIAHARNAIDHVKGDYWAQDILRQAYSCATGHANRIDASGVRNGYDFR